MQKQLGARRCRFLIPRKSGNIRRKADAPPKAV
jgi:hypothetical protein